MPRRNFTAASVEKIKPPKSGQVDHFDGGYPGLSLRISYGARKAWNFHYRFGGKLRRMKLGTYPGMSLAEAREAWRVAREEVEGGRDPRVVKVQEKPADDFATVAAAWLKRDQAGNRSLPETTRILERDLLPAWGPRPINEIKRKDVIELLDTIIDRGAAPMAARVQSLIHRLFRWAAGRSIIEINPAAGLDRPALVSRDRVLTDDELMAVWAAAEELGAPYGRAAQLLALTGARRAEISQLKWSEIEGNTITLVGVRTKNGETHDIPLSATAEALIKSVPRIAGCEYAFTADGKQPIRGWSEAKIKLDKGAKIKPWRIHDLRRTVATGLQKMGVNLQVTEAVLGHTTGSRSGIVGVYQRHNYADEKRAALEAWGAHVMGLLQGRKPGVVLPLHGRA